MLVYKIYGLVCNLGHVLKPSSHRAGLENIWFVGSNIEIVGARGGHTNKLYSFIYFDADVGETRALW